MNKATVLLTSLGSSCVKATWAMDKFLLKTNDGGAIGARSKLKITTIQTGTGNPPVRPIASPQNIGTLRRRLGVIFYRERAGPPADQRLSD
jgi:hypothetical protein